MNLWSKIKKVEKTFLWCHHFSTLLITWAELFKTGLFSANPGLYFLKTTKVKPGLALMQLPTAVSCNCHAVTTQAKFLFAISLINIIDSVRVINLLGFVTQWKDWLNLTPRKSKPIWTLGKTCLGWLSGKSAGFLPQDCDWGSIPRLLAVICELCLFLMLFSPMTNQQYAKMRAK